MADLRAIEPPVWVVIFRPSSASWFIRNLLPGRFKHVSACAYLADHRLWLTYDVGIDRTKITLIPDGEQVEAILAPWLDGCTLVMMTNPRAALGLPLLGWCAPSIARLVGLRGITLRPDALYRQCLRNGGTIVNARFRSDTPG